MTEFRQFEVFKDHAECRLVARASLHEAARMITAAIVHAREQDQRNLLLDITGLTGFAPPGMGQRFFFFEEWARAARARVRVAFVARPEMIDSGKFGVTVAANNNFTADAFTSTAEAMAWLIGPT
jgi:hypothetical protein